MPDLIRVRTEWSGSTVVGPGVSTFYLVQSATGFVSAINTFWDSLKTLFPATTTWTTPSSGDLIDEATGALSGTWTDAPAGPTVSSTPGDYASGVGARVKWLTSGVTNGRRVRGSTFLVPLRTAGYDVDGTISASELATMSGAVSALVTALSPDLVIYTRPVGGSGGASSVVLSGSVPDTVSWLRSRRT